MCDRHFSQEVRAAVIRSAERPTVGGSTNLTSCNDECLSAWTTPCASTINWTRVVFYREGLLVGNIPCLRSLLAVVALPYRHNLVKETLNTHTICQLGICDDSFSVLCLIFALTLNIRS